MKLDNLDTKILCELRKNSRITYKELAKEVGSNINTVASRIKRLEKNRYILGYCANIDFEKVGYSACGIVRVKLDNPGSLNRDALADIIAIPDVSILVGATGLDDASIIIKSKNFTDLVNEIGLVGKNKHVVGLTSEYLIKDYKTYEEFNPFIDGNSVKLHTYRKRKKPLDELDLGILRELRSNANAPLRVLSSKLKKPISTIKERTDRLEANGIIKGFVANVNFVKLGYWGFAAVRIKLHRAHLTDDKVVEKLLAIPEIAILSRTMGFYELVSGILVKDTDHMVQILKRISSIEGIMKLETEVALSVLKTSIDYNPFDRPKEDN